MTNFLFYYKNPVCEFGTNFNREILIVCCSLPSPLNSHKTLLSQVPPVTEQLLINI